MKTYYLMWKGEVIADDIETREEAEYLRREYQIAYGGVVTIKVKTGERYAV